MGRKSQEDERVREKLVDHAFHMICREGAGFSIRELERSVGISPSTLRRLYPNKETLLAAVLEQDYAELRSWASGHVGTEVPGASVDSWAEQITAHLVGVPGVADFLIEALASSSSSLHGMSSNLMEITGKIVLTTNDQSADPHDIYVAILACIGAAERLHPGDEGTTHKARYDRATRMFGVLGTRPKTR